MCWYIWTVCFVLGPNVQREKQNKWSWSHLIYKNRHNSTKKLMPNDYSGANTEYVCILLIQAGQESHEPQRLGDAFKKSPLI